jgi:rhodanese-related sulfurtransferase
VPSPTQITVPQLSRVVGLPGAPAVVDVRPPEELGPEPVLLPTARHMDPRAASAWAGAYAGRRVVAYCRDGGHVSQGAAAWLRDAGADAETLQGGLEAWRGAGQPLMRPDRLPRRNDDGRTVWVTRARPKVVRVACPWLIRRFVDPGAAFLFVAPSEVSAAAAFHGATPFDTGEGIWSDRGGLCTFDVMVEEFGLATEPLLRLAAIVRGADTGRPDLTPQSAGLLAVSLGLSRTHQDDLAQLEAAMPLYDALYRWCRDGTDETHG